MVLACDDQSMQRTRGNITQVDEFAAKLAATAPTRNLLRTARERLGMSHRIAGKRASYSGTRWMNIEQGYITATRGVQVAIAAPRLTLARMAAAVGITAAQLREVGRDDAAETMERVYPIQAVKPQLDRSLPSQMHELADALRLLADGDRPELLRHLDLLVQWSRGRIAGQDVDGQGRLAV
jgi:hypothetical protein